MAQIILGIAAILALHSLGLIIASLVTNKWYTDSKKDIGVYGICEHVQTVTSFNETYYYYRNKYSYVNSRDNGTVTNVNLSTATPAVGNHSGSGEDESKEADGVARSWSPVKKQHQGLMKKRRNNNVFLITDENSPLTTSQSREKTNQTDTSGAAPKSGVVKKSTTNNTKCYQLIWPDSQQAYQYLTGETLLTSLKWTLKLEQFFPVFIYISSVFFANFLSFFSFNN